MTRREKQCRRILSTSLLEATVPSNEVSSSSDCENRTGTEKLNDLVLVLSDCEKRKNDLEVLGLSLFPSQKKIGRYVRKASLSDITDQSKCLC